MSNPASCFSASPRPAVRSLVLATALLRLNRRPDGVLIYSSSVFTSTKPATHPAMNHRGKLKNFRTRSTATHISSLSGALAKVVGDIDDETSLVVPRRTQFRRVDDWPLPPLSWKVVYMRRAIRIPLFLLLDLFSPLRRRDMISALLASRKVWNPLCTSTCLWT
ncbi:hypothetical protein K443DRAFT_205653 [Laccaria amethystina LaAM-08-1]|uniref:Uncharacterized protein n=1 Tax=Laccaria amethystina LaAM-08-1 TaxID=1095629 RepID=A0A0C9XRP4_9AGAR|nr:hypothetical protein K443DRAFT_205653 [Laccaria amethystina LaAM-08-1]